MTTAFRQTAERDPSNTDWYITKIDMSVQSIFTADVLPLMFPNLANKTDNAADIMMVVRSMLLKPRRAFSVSCDGQELIPTTAPGGVGVVDTQNGPQPQSCDVIQLNDTSFLVTWHVIACYWENNELTLDNTEKVLNAPGNPVLYNRWSETQEIDQCLFTKKTREGKFVIRSDNNQGKIVDKFRSQMAILGVPKGFLRESWSYTVDPSGLGLEYRFVDVQQYKMPPSPAYKASGDYTEEKLRNGGQRWGSVYVRLEGSADSSQVRMMIAAVAIAFAKLRANGTKQGGLDDPNINAGRRIGTLEHLHVKTGLYENTVEVRARARLKPSRTRVGIGQRGKFWQDNPEAFVFTPGSDDVERVMKYPIRGTAGTPQNRILLQAAAYYDPNLVNTVVDHKKGQLNAPNQLEVGQAGIKLEP
jgi:hypothetical protein